MEKYIRRANVEIREKSKPFLYSIGIKLSKLVNNPVEVDL
jgi:hypothetical protein